jgi:hypothetical protein
MDIHWFSSTPECKSLQPENNPEIEDNTWETEIILKQVISEETEHLNRK